MESVFGLPWNACSAWRGIGVRLGAEYAGYRRQLLLYSHLLHRMRGEWPAWVGIRYLDGQEDVLDLVPAEADRVAFETLALREDFNLRVSSGELEGLAAPSAESCAFCDYPCLCEPFFAAVQPHWQLGRTAVLGEVAEVVTTDSAAHLQLHVRACSREVGAGPVTLRGLPLQLAPARGALVAFSRLRSNATASTLTVSWDSRMHVWPGPHEGVTPSVKAQADHRRPRELGSVRVLVVCTDDL